MAAVAAATYFKSGKQDPGRLPRAPLTIFATIRNRVALESMHRSDHSRFQQAHDFVPDFSKAERRTRIVIGVTAVMMVLEIVVGLMSHSMALLADGWHMSTHVIAFVITAAAYYLARRHATNVRFSFGTGKIGVLGGFTSAVVLSIVAFLMAGESVRRLFVPLTIHFNEAIGIACLGLAVNLGCAFLLKDGRNPEDDTRGSTHHHDLNLRAAYLHAGYIDPKRPFSWRTDFVRSGGGAIMDLGAHVIDLMRFLLERPAVVRAGRRSPESSWGRRWRGSWPSASLPPSPGSPGRSSPRASC